MRLLLVALLALALFFGGPFGGCPCVTEPTLSFHEDFEYGDGLCGWELLAGEARLVETLTASEHALQFVTPGASVRHAASMPPDDPVYGDAGRGGSLRLLTDCWGPPDGFPDAPGVLQLGLSLEFRNPDGTVQTRAGSLSCVRDAGTLHRCSGGATPLVDPDAGAAPVLGGIVLTGRLPGCVVDHVVVERILEHC